MITINKDSDLYPVVANIVSTVFGFGASVLIHAFGSGVISSSNSTGITKFGMQAGLVGIETITLYDVATTMRDEIDDFVDGYNNFAEVMNRYKQEKNEKLMYSEGAE